MNMIRPALVQHAACVVTVTFLLSNVLGAQAREKSTYNSVPENGVYEVGHGVTAPKPTYTPNPEFSDKARKKKIQGTVIVSMVVTAEGNVRDVSVTKSVEQSLDQQAIATISTWKFEPATKDGKPVTVHLHTEVDFRLK